MKLARPIIKKCMSINFFRHHIVCKQMHLIFDILFLECFYVKVTVHVTFEGRPTNHNQINQLDWSQQTNSPNVNNLQPANVQLFHCLPHMHNTLPHILDMVALI